MLTLMVHVWLLLAGGAAALRFGQDLLTGMLLIIAYGGALHVAIVYYNLVGMVCEGLVEKFPRLTDVVAVSFLLLPVVAVFYVDADLIMVLLSNLPSLEPCREFAICNASTVAPYAMSAEWWRIPHLLNSAFAISACFSTLAAGAILRDGGRW